MISFQKATPKDIPFIHEWEEDLQIRKFFNSGAPLKLHNSIDSYPDYFLISDGNIPIGITQIKLWRNQIYTTYYIGNKEYRKRGYSKKIVAARTEFILREFGGSKIIFVDVNVLNYPAWSALLSNNFQLWGVEPKGAKINEDLFTQLRFIYTTEQTEFTSLYQEMSQYLEALKPQFKEDYSEYIRGFNPPT